MQNEQHFFVGEQPGQRQQEMFFLNTLPLIRRFTVARLRGLYRDQAEDLVQRIGLNLWRWRMRKADESQNEPLKNSSEDLSSKTNPFSGAHQTAVAEIGNHQRKSAQQNELTADEWLKLANTVTHNEINSFYRSKYRRERQLTESLPEKYASENTDYNQSLTCLPSAQVAGNSRAEVASLLNQVWRIIETFSLRRKYSYLLNREELIVNLITHGCTSRKRLAETLDLTVVEFDIIVKNLPLADEQINNLVGMKTGRRATVRQIWTWRAKAKKQLAEKLRDKI